MNNFVGNMIFHPTGFNDDMSDMKLSQQDSEYISEERCSIPKDEYDEYREGGVSTIVPNNMTKKQSNFDNSQSNSDLDFLGTKCTCNASSRGKPNVSLDDVDLLNLDDYVSEDEDSWLQDSFKIQQDSPSRSPYKWVREEFDDNKPQHCHNSLLRILDDVSRNKTPRFRTRLYDVVSPQANSPVHVDASVLINPRCEVEQNRSNTVPVQNKFIDILEQTNSDCVPENKASLVPEVGKIDTRTFPRPKKQKKIEKIEAADNILEASLVLAAANIDIKNSKSTEECAVVLPSLPPQNKISSRNGIPSKSLLCAPKLQGHGNMTKEQFYLGGDSSGESLEDCMTSAGGEEAFRPANVIDVQNLAKKQEELLRQSFCSPTGLSRTGASRLTKSTGRLTDCLDNGTFSLSANQSSQPGKYRTDSLFANKSTSSLGSVSSADSNDSPSEGLGSVVHPLGTKSRGVVESHQRSMPNLCQASKFSLQASSRTTEKAPRAPQMPGKSSSTEGMQDSQLACLPGQSFGHQTMAYTGPGQSSVVHHTTAHSGLQKPVAHNPSSVTGAREESPSRTTVQIKSSIPMSRVTSGIPRPNSVSKLKPPTRSCLPVSGMKRNFSAPRNNDVWQEDCF